VILASEVGVLPVPEEEDRVKRASASGKNAVSRYRKGKIYQDKN
jgi:hypothetical protein